MTEQDYKIFLTICYKVLNDSEKLVFKEWLNEHRESFIILDPISRVIIVLGYLKGMLNIPD